MFTIGQTVVCTDDSGSQTLDEGTEYDVKWVSDAGLAIQVDEIKAKFKASRFQDSAEWQAAQAKKDLEDAAPEYEAFEVEGCCGAATVFFQGDLVLNEYSLDNINGENPGYGIFFGILNEEQNTEANRDLLISRGWIHVATSAANENPAERSLYTYYLITKPAQTL